MTYRQKLILKRTLIVLAIILAALLILAIIGFTYLGRFVVYTEEGAHFSFHTQAPAESPAGGLAAAPEPIELVIGSAISAEEGQDDSHNISDRDVSGMLLDYETLSDGSTLGMVDLSDESSNTLVLEMRSGGSDLLRSDAVLALIRRAQNQDLRLIAMISCLDDSAYALDHQELGLAITGGALWMDRNGRYFLDPTQDAVINYLAGMIKQLSDMGFDEVILNQFYFPASESIVYDTGDSSRDELLVKAFQDLVDATVRYCDIGLLVAEPEEGHQALEAADRIYVYFSEGSQVKSYAENHPDHYLVFITNSHDTRFEGYGKLTTEHDLAEPEPEEEEGADAEPDTGDAA